MCDLLCPARKAGHEMQKDSDSAVITAEFTEIEVFEIG